MPSEVIQIPPRPLKLSQTRDRKTVLGILLPKFFGIIWDRGAPSYRLGGISAQVGDDLEIGAHEMRRGAYVISSYLLGHDARWTKVFSAHVGS